MKFKFYIDSKMIVWQRSIREIEANSEAEAKEIAKRIFKDDHGQSELDSEIMEDTMESMDIGDNNGQSTCELMWPTDNEYKYNIIMDNRPISIIRDEKINKILYEK
jgi:hypothetical protein